MTTTASSRSSATISSSMPRSSGADPDEAGIGGAGCRYLIRGGRGDHVHRVGLAGPVAACCAVPPDDPIHSNNVAQKD